ncbi:hypothetical protein EMCRGX_G002010 [Ephydatia muelleri]
MTRRLDCFTPFTKIQQAVTLEFIKRKRRWLNVTIGRPQILQHLSSVSKAEQDAKKTSELHPVQALSNMLSVTFFLMTNSSVDEQPMLSQIQPTNLHSHEQTKQPSDQTLKCYASSNSFNEVKSVTKIASEELKFTICDTSYTSCEAENEPMIQTNSGTQHFVMKSDFQQLLNGECFGDNVIEVQNRCVKLYDSVFESIQGNAITVLRLVIGKKSPLNFPTKSIVIRSWLALRLMESLSSVVTINDKTEQFILNQCSTEVLLDVKASIEKEHLRLICKNLVKSGFFDVYIQGKRDGVFSSLNPTQLKSLFRKWPIINCKVVDAVQHFLYGIAIGEGYGGNRANILAWDVLYPELMISIISKSKEMNYEEAELYFVDNLLN